MPRAGHPETNRRRGGDALPPGFEGFARQPRPQTETPVEPAPPPSADDFGGPPSDDRASISNPSAFGRPGAVPAREVPLSAPDEDPARERETE